MQIGKRLPIWLKDIFFCIGVVVPPSLILFRFTFIFICASIILGTALLIWRVRFISHLMSKAADKANYRASSKGVIASVFSLLRQPKVWATLLTQALLRLVVFCQRSLHFTGIVAKPEPDVRMWNPSAASHRSEDPGEESVPG